MRTLVFLHSTGDLAVLQMLVSLAGQDIQETGLQPWIDTPHVRDQDVLALGSETILDEQISTVIKTAGAIVYCVGRSGLGPYQEAVESELVRNAIAARAAEGDPLRFVPVLLSDGLEADMPQWAHAYIIVNQARTDRHPHTLWQLIKQRLAGGAPTVPAQPRELPSKRNELIEKILGSVLERSVLTMFIGPYASDSHGGVVVGPSAMTQSLLEHIGIGGMSDHRLPPWPSDVAEWLALTGLRTEGHRGMRKLLSPLSQRPPELVHSIAHLAEKWIEKWGERIETKRDWQGLLLLTTRVDLALESALARQSKVGFTRILPTLNHAESSQDLRRLVQDWRPDGTWSPDLSVLGSDTAPASDIAANKKGQLANFPLEKAKRVVLVKLCGTLEIPESMFISGYDFFGNSSHFDHLPRGVNEAIATSPHLFLGRGFASPLAQLIRHKLIDRYHTKQPCVMLLPESMCEGDPHDPLCDLDLALLGQDEQAVIRSLNISAIHRGPEHEFVRKLAERI